MKTIITLKILKLKALQKTLQKNELMMTQREKKK